MNLSVIRHKCVDLSVIRHKCAEKNLTFAALERATGIGNGVIAKWKNGNPRIHNLEKVATYFGCTVDDLLREETNGAEVR